METIYKIFLLVTCISISSCATYKDVLYFQDIDKATLDALTSKYEVVIKKDDELKIIITSGDKTVTDPYNFTIGEISSGYSTLADPETPIMSCIVDTEGNISFPILGKIHVEGMTRIQLIDYLTERIKHDVKDVVVYVSFRNYKFTVLGEVRNPGTFTYKSEKLNILQAIGYAGDLNVTAMRDGVILLREVDGAIQHIRIDLRKSDILDSPYFYLQQNDVIYVPPSSTRLMMTNSSAGVWSAVSSIASTLSLTVAILALVL
ncbi:MAG: polysaccharide biosynthesis/export family protein [Bacteroidales bacterium]|nr:polysaccharide biosynthesis/export family protein [Bacteroidales bacterium]